VARSHRYYVSSLFAALDSRCPLTTSHLASTLHRLSFSCSPRSRSPSTFKFSSRLFAHGDENFSFKGGNPNLGSENFFGILISPTTIVEITRAMTDARCGSDVAVHGFLFRLNRSFCGSRPGILFAVCKKVGGHAICINFFAQLARAISPQPGRGFL
jgi:hypothetical protein